MTGGLDEQRDEVQRVGHLLADAIRLQASLEEQLKAARASIGALTDELLTIPYLTGNAVADGSAPVSRLRVAEWVPPAEPGDQLHLMRSAPPLNERDRTRRLNPVADVTGRDQLIGCPNDDDFAWVNCEERLPHVHTADGAVHPTTLR